MIRILSPLDNVEETARLIEAGADELYCGLIDERWMQKYPISPINRRVAKVCNLRSLEELGNCLEIAHHSGVRVGLTVNEHFYTRQQYPMLLQYIKKAQDCGIDSLLVSDIALVLHLKETGLKIPIHMSTGATILNSFAARFYRDIGAVRVTLERHVSIGEIDRIVKDSGIETCVFIMNSRCSNIDGLCTFIHVQSSHPYYKNACMLNYDIEMVNMHKNATTVKDINPADLNGYLMRQSTWSRHHMDEIPCGACALFDLSNIGVDYVKIVGRGNQSWRKVVDIKFICHLLEKLEERKLSRTEFYAYARNLYAETYQRKCQMETCYYPEVLGRELVLVDE